MGSVKIENILKEQGEAVLMKIAADATVCGVLA